MIDVTHGMISQNQSLKKRLLVVDDEPQVLKLLQLALKPLGQECEMVFVDCGRKALEAMDQQPFDIILSDMRMPGMSGAELLNVVVKRYPRTVRIILSGYSDQEVVLKCVGATHQFFSKPFDPLALRAVLFRIIRLQDRLRNPQLTSLVAGINSLPSIPALYIRLIEALQNADCPIETVSDIVSEDPALAAKCLQLVNSAFFGFSRSVSTVGEAVQLLGVSLIRSMALGVHLFSAFNGHLAREFSVDRIWHHSVCTGLLARRLAETEGQDEQFMEQAFTAGLLHDIGKLAFAAHFSDAYRQMLACLHASDRSLIQAEMAAFQITHADLGTYLLALWGLPTPLLEAVAWHHEPSAAGDTDFTPLTAVHVANALAHLEGTAELGAFSNVLDLPYLNRLRLEGRLAVWRTAV